MVKYLSLTEIETVKVRSPKTSSNTLINFVSGENFSWDMDRIWEYLSVMETSDLYEAERGATGDKLQEIYIYWLYQTIRRTHFVTGIEKQNICDAVCICCVGAYITMQTDDNQ